MGCHSAGNIRILVTSLSMMVPNAETCCGDDVGSSPIFTKQRCTRPGTKETYDKVNITFDFLVHVLHGQLACLVELDYTEI